MKKKHTKHKILIPLFYDYHLFGYLENVLLSFVQHGFDVSILTSDPKIVERYGAYEEKLAIVKSIYPRIIMRLMDNRALRPFGWLIGWGWSYLATIEYSAVVLPRDTRPLQYLVSVWRPTLLIQPSLGKYTKLYLSHKYGSENDFPIPVIHSHFPVTDKLFGGNYLSSVYKPMKNKTYAVIGNDFKTFYEALGARPSRVVVTGNPNYEGLKRYSKADDALSDIKQAISYQEDEIVVSFFPSQLEFSETALSNLSGLLSAIDRKEGSPLLFIIKPHPRTSQEEKIKLKDLSAHLNNTRLIILEDFYGDEHNARLISLSSAVFVEESNVGILAAYLETPLFVFEISGEDQSNLFKLFNLPVLSAQNVQECLHSIETHKFSAEAQKIMLEKITKRLESPHTEIVELLKKITHNT